MPVLDNNPMTNDERELAVMLHGSIVVLGLREHVHRGASLGSSDKHVRRHALAFQSRAKNGCVRDRLKRSTVGHVAGVI